MFNLTPSALGGMSMIGAIGGVAQSMIGAFYSAKSQQSALEYQADMSRINARISEMGAQSVLEQGNKNAAAQTLKAGMLKSTQRAGLAANGVDLGEGNAAETLASTDIMKEIDKNQITANAVAQAWGLRTQGVNASNDALIKSATAGSISPFSAAATSLISGASRVASSWYMMNRAGVGGSNTGSTGAPLGDAPMASNSWEW